MSRSEWKGPFINLQELKVSDVRQTAKQSTNNKIITISRDSEVVPAFIGFTFNVHNGKSYNEITVNSDMVKHKFGEFSFTRSKYIFKKKKQKRLGGAKSKSKRT
jgi:small subunit ribosomal protein S19